MARWESREAFAFSIPFGPSTSIGVEGEMARVSVASLLEGAGQPVVVGSDGVTEAQVAVGQHGMIMDLYSSGSLSSVTLDFGLAMPAAPITVDDIGRHDSVGTVSGGDVHVPLADLLHGEIDAVGASLGFAGEQHIPDEMQIPIAGQSALGSFEVPLGHARGDHFSTLGGVEFSHFEVATLFGNDGLMPPISEQHVIA